MKKNKLRWFGHVLREVDNDEIVKKIGAIRIEPNRRRGRH